MSKAIVTRSCEWSRNIALIEAPREKEAKEVLDTSDREQRQLRGAFYTLYEELKVHPHKFFSYFRRCQETVNLLKIVVGPRLVQQDTRLRKCVPVEERIAATFLTEKYFKTEKDSETATRQLNVVIVQYCRAWQDCSICKFVKLELDQLLAVRNINE